MSLLRVCACIAPRAISAGGESVEDLRLLRVHSDGSVDVARKGGLSTRVAVGERVGDWTLMDVAAGASPSMTLEDFVRRDESALIYVDAGGVRLALPKTAESTEDTTGGRFLGHTAAEVWASAGDLLGERVLAGAGDPDYDLVASAFPPIRKVLGGIFDFVGTPDTFDKVGFDYGGRSPNVDPAIYQPSLDDVRKAGKVWNGLVGGWLPVLRFVYPEDDDAWTELLAFAPFRVMEGNDRIQPVWYRVSRIERGTLLWSRYVDTYVAFPMRPADAPHLATAFYAELSGLHADWETILAPACRLDLPDRRLQNLARFGLVRSIMTRIGDHPKYGVLDRNYGGAEHDGFPDTFTVETTAMLEWGLIDRAGRYVDNYLTHFVRDDGSLLYRGPETGQYGRMLTVAAQYVWHGGDPALVLRHRPRLDAIARLLLDLRGVAQRLPRDHPAYGMISAWNEADSVLEPDPWRYMQPYFANSAEAARGFLELGSLWMRLGTDTDDELRRWGRRLATEGADVQRDLHEAIGRSLLRVDGETVLPSIAGVTEPFHVAVARDRTDPQYRAYRAHMEALHSGMLTAEEADLVIDYRTGHHDVLLGMPTAYGYNTGEMAGFLSYGHGFGLLQQDRVREALLLLYSDMAHQYTRGGWLAPETRRQFGDWDAAPYCTPAQLSATLLTRWLLVFEDPRGPTLWLGKALPREWLAEGQVVEVQDVPTRWGRVGYRIASHVLRRCIEVQVQLPEDGVPVVAALRLRAPHGLRLDSVTIDGRDVDDFDADTETITLPRGRGGAVSLVARYAGSAPC